MVHACIIVTPGVNTRKSRLLNELGEPNVLGRVGVVGPFVPPTTPYVYVLVPLYSTAKINFSTTVELELVKNRVVRKISLEF